MILTPALKQDLISKKAFSEKDMFAHPLSYDTLLSYVDFHRIGPLGRFGLVVAMPVRVSVCLSVPFPCNFLRPWTGADCPSSVDWCGASLALAWSPKKGEVFRGVVDRPRVGGVQIVDWCTRQPTRRALKRGVVPDCTHGSSTRGRCLTGGLVQSSTNT